jgi:single-stranded DNA-binding protein
MKGNQIIIHGNVVKEAKVFADKKFAIIRLASNYSDKKDGQKTMYFDVKIFGDRLGDIEYFEPVVGDRLCVTGQLALDEYEKDGMLRSSMVIYCDHLEKIWRKPKSAPQTEDKESKADF